MYILRPTSLGSGSAVSANGTFSFTTEAQTSTALILFTVGTTTLKIDNVSVKEHITATNTPRLDYSTGAEAFLLEPQSTNLITYSEDFSNSFWLIQNLSVTLNSIISPNGNLNATKLTENTSNSTHRILNSSGLIVSGNVAMSVFAKKGERNWIRLTNNNIRGAFFDLDNGIIGGVSTGITAKIENYGNGWYRCYISQTGVANERLGIYTSIDGVNTTYQGDGTSGVYIYGAQLEQQSYATSYIPTSGAAATRNQELCADATPVINSEEGTLYAEIAALANDLTFRGLSISDGTTSNACRIYYRNSSNRMQFLFTVGGASQVSSTFDLADIKDYNKIAFSYKQNDFKIYINGVKVITDTNGIVPSENTFNKLSFNRGDNGEVFYGNTKGLKYYPKALADVQLEDLTTI